MLPYRQGKKIPGLVGWAGVALAVGVWDLHPRTETLSRSFAPKGTHGRWFMLLVWAYLSLHLTRTLPGDPLWAFERRHGK